MRIAFIGAESSHERPPTSSGWVSELGLDARRRRPRRGVRGDRAAHPRAPRTRPVRGHEVHDGAARALVPSGDAARRRAQRRLRRALLLGARGAARRRARPTRALHLGRRATRTCASSSTRSGARLGGAYRVLVDANQHVDREAAARSGVGFYGKNTMLITRRHGSWVVLGTLVTDVELEPTPPLDAGCGECRLCIDACPTGALDEPGTLDATKCLSYWTQAPAPMPEDVPRRARRAGLRLRHLPGRLPVEPRRREAAGRHAGVARRVTSISSPGSRPTAARSSTTTSGSTSRATTRAGCGATRSSRSATSAAPSTSRCSRGSRHDDDDARARARCVGARRGSRSAREEPAALARMVDLASSASAPCRSRVLQVSLTDGIPPRDRAGRVGARRPSLAVGAVRAASRSPSATATSRLHAASRWRSTSRSSARFVLLFAFEPGTPTRQLLLIASRRRRDPLRHARRHPDRARVRPGRGLVRAAARRPVRRRASGPTTSPSRPAPGFDHGAARRLARQPHRDASARNVAAPRARRPRRCATSSAAAPTCSMPRTVARARSARRSISTRRPARSSASCAGSCRSSAWRSCSPRRASRA